MQFATKKGWGTIYLGNHDQPRMTSRWEMTQYRELSSKMLSTGSGARKRTKIPTTFLSRYDGPG
jgi:glycosidase